MKVFLIQIKFIEGKTYGSSVERVFLHQKVVGLIPLFQFSMTSVLEQDTEPQTI